VGGSDRATPPGELWSPSLDLLDRLIRALKEGDGATVQDNRESLTRALWELKRYRNRYPTEAALRGLTAAMLSYTVGHHRYAMSMAEEHGAWAFLREWGIEP
jgi:hypothetical protein